MASVVAANDYDGWELLRDLGRGGQGDVYLVTSPSFSGERRLALDSFFALIDGQTPPAVPEAYMRDANTIRQHMRESLPNILRGIVRPGTSEDLGALKVVRLPTQDKEKEKVAERFALEAKALGELSHPSILRLLYVNLQKHFMVSEYHPSGSLENHLQLYQGNAEAALNAFAGLVRAAALLHGKRYVHRDIKLANIFVGAHGHLVLGDFGIVFYRDDDPNRFTATFERVGPRDWMPPWAHTGQRLEDVGPSFDVFSLGKVLWAMVSGRGLLPFWYHRRPDYDLQRMFPKSPEMSLINDLLDACIVEDEANCLKSATELEDRTEETLRVLRARGLPPRLHVKRRCRVCAAGHYRTAIGPPLGRLLSLPVSVNRQSIELHQMLSAALPVRAFACDNCGHLELFMFPDDNPPKGWGSEDFEFEDQDS